MNELNIWHILIYLGAAQGVFLTIVFLFSKKYNRTSTRFLALALISCAVLNFNAASHLICLQCVYPLFGLMPLNWSIVIPFSLFYFIQYLLNPLYKWGRMDWLAFLPILCYIFFAMYFFLCALLNGTEHTNLDQFTTGNVVFETIAIVYLSIVFYLSFKKFDLFNEQLFNQYSNIESNSLNWIRKALFGVMILAILWIISVVNEWIQWYPMRIFSYPLLIGMSGLIYWVGYTMYLSKDLFEVDTIIAESHDPGMDEKNTISNKAKEHYENLLDIVKNKKLYLDQELSMTALASETGLSNGYLSQIINQMEGKNFFEFINSYRVAEVKELMKDPKFSNYTLLGLAQEAGFNSKSTFNAVFKRLTGQTPSAYRKMNS